jgi:hypothetical protein
MAFVAVLLLCQNLTYLSLLQDAVRSQNTLFMIGQISRGSAQGRQMAWEFFKSNQSALYKRYLSSTLLARLVNVCLSILVCVCICIMWFVCVWKREHINNNIFMCICYLILWMPVCVHVCTLVCVCILVCVCVLLQRISLCLQLVTCHFATEDMAKEIEVISFRLFFTYSHMYYV